MRWDIWKGQLAAAAAVGTTQPLEPAAVAGSSRQSRLVVGGQHSQAGTRVARTHAQYITCSRLVASTLPPPPGTSPSRSSSSATTGSAKPHASWYRAPREPGHKVGGSGQARSGLGQDSSWHRSGQVKGSEDRPAARSGHRPCQDRTGQGMPWTRAGHWSGEVS